MDEQTENRGIIYLLLIIGMWIIPIEALFNPIFRDGTFLPMALRISVFVFTGTLTSIVSIGLFIGFFPDLAIDIYNRIRLNIYGLTHSDDGIP